MNKPSIEKIEFYQLTLAIEFISDIYNIDQSLLFGDIEKNIAFDFGYAFEITKLARYYKMFWEEFGEDANFIW